MILLHQVHSFDENLLYVKLLKKKKKKLSIQTGRIKCLTETNEPKKVIC